eukprot:Gb_07818 [translate_table: standard]
MGNFRSWQFGVVALAALSVHVLMISGFAEELQEFATTRYALGKKSSNGHA